MWKQGSALLCQINNKSSKSGGQHFQIIKLMNYHYYIINYYQIIKNLAINNYHSFLLAAKIFSFVFCLRFLLTSFLLISTKYLIDLLLF